MTETAVLIAGTNGSYLEISKKLLMLHDRHCVVDFAYSCRECVEKASAKPYHMILFDYDLGDMQGSAIVETLKAAGISAPLIIMVDEGDEMKAMAAIERGAHDYILKVRGYLTALPFTIRTILKKAANQSGTQAPGRPDGAAAASNWDAASCFILDRKGCFLAAGSEVQKVTGFSEEELLALRFSDLLPKESEPAFADWLYQLASQKGSKQTFDAEIVSKKGRPLNLAISLTAIKDETQDVQSFGGRIRSVEVKGRPGAVSDSGVDTLAMITALSRLVTSCYDEPLHIFLERIAELASQTFRFQRATIALLNARKKVFVKQALVGYNSPAVGSTDEFEVPQEVIQRAFSRRFRVKVIYYEQEERDLAASLSSKFPERRTQQRRPMREWHERDLILVNLQSRDGRTFGYISLDRPEAGHVPERDAFLNLEVFGQFVSFAVENYYQFSSLSRRSRRLKQVLVTSNIFKLHLSLNELLHEVVWSVRFSTEFKLVALGLVSKRSSQLEIKAAACEDKIKAEHLRNIRIPLPELTKLLRPEYKCGKSYLAGGEKDVVRPMKNIYYGPRLNGGNGRPWSDWSVLVVPIKCRQGRIIGALIVDDPEDGRLPEREVINTLEIIANRVAVAIDNRILYVKDTRNKRTQERGVNIRRELMSDLRTSRVRHSFMDRFFK